MVNKERQFTLALISIYPPRGDRHSDSGGVAGYSKNLLESLANIAQRDTRICIIADKKSNQRQSYTEGSINIVEAFDRNLKYFWQINKELRKVRPDVVHIQQELGIFGSYITALVLPLMILIWKIKTPIITTLHGVVSLKDIDSTFVKNNNSSAPYWVVRIIFKILFSSLAITSSTIIVHEHKFKKILEQDYLTKSKKIHVVSHGIESLASIKSTLARKKLKLPTDANIVLFLGYATGYKGIDLLIEGFARYKLNDPTALLIVGAGKHPKLQNDATYITNTYDRLRNKATSTLHESVSWRGFIKDNELALYYSAADISVFPYLYEMSSSGPMSLSMSYKKPFIMSTAFSGIDEHILKFDLNEHSLADKLSSFFANSKEIQNRVQAMAVHRSWDSVAIQTHQIYIGSIT